MAPWLDIFLRVLSGIGVCGGIIFSSIALMRSRQGESHDDGQSKGVMLTEIGYIKAGVDDVKKMQDKQNEGMKDMQISIAKLEESTKSAHNRIDGIEDKLLTMK